MFGRLQAEFSLLLAFLLFAGAAATGCVMKGTTENFVTIKTAQDCRSTSRTLVLARESLDFTVRPNGDVHASKITFKFGSSCSAKMDVVFVSGSGGKKTPKVEFNGKTFLFWESSMQFEVKGALNTSALVFSSFWSKELKKTGFFLVVGALVGGVFACRHFKWLCWSGRGKTAPVAQPAVKTAGSRRSQRTAKAAAAPAPLLPTPTPTTITPLSRGLTVHDEPPPPTVEHPPAGGKKKKAEPSTITHSIGLTCHDDPPPRRPLGPPSKPNAAKKKEEGCGTKTADAFGLHVHDEPPPPKTPKRSKSAGLTVQDKSEPTKTVWTGATVVTEEGSKPSKESAPSGPSGSK
ncbi:hypothetical protein M3Y99_01575200 [Aphelenchoides fujianensis]|nr:hypothetical protein M3Y99_01575200 [Aphelenchoides fujianensis]